MDNVNRRVSPRVQVPIDVVWHGGSGRTVSRIEDLSASGCLVGSLAAPSPGERVRLEIDLPPKHEHLSVDAEVVRRQPNMGFGVRFPGLRSQTQDALSFAVDALSGKSLPLWLLQQGSRSARCWFRLRGIDGLRLSVEVDQPSDVETATCFTEQFDSWNELVVRARQQRERLEVEGWVLVHDAT